MSYRILIPGGIEYPTDPSVIRKLKRGERMPYEARGHRRAERGDVVDDIPKESVAVLVKKGWIEVTEGE